jgi:hypothetical protein
VKERTIALTSSLDCGWITQQVSVLENIPFFTVKYAFQWVPLFVILNSKLPVDDKTFNSLVNYPFAKDKWASGFTDLRFFTEVLFVSPPV